MSPTLAVTMVSLHHGNVTHTTVGTIPMCTVWLAGVVLMGMGAVYAKPTCSVIMPIPTLDVRYLG